ncbi:unnamed protein product [Diatraea saccharalis]|uniref:Uncharacterized protein n=1 Tax=Diatraea saccharalis TaxID=40085 RepID=A0A9N9R386_9NEOP|nr:unnamed protein product [Diatraea saccharalis]
MYGSWNKDSSYPWCLTECRKRTIAALCNCLPFTLIPNANDTTCTPEHLICLAKHREKFLYYYPGKDADFKSLTKERQDSQQCQHCMPDCTRDWYTTVPFRIKHYFSKKFWTNKFS